MNKEINLEINERNSLMRFNYLNGSIDFPLNENTYGAYAMCPGCGSGKTTIIKDIIKFKWSEGILYSAFTRDEVNEMYNYCVENIVGRYRSIDGTFLTLDDIVVLHSDYSAEGTNKNLWENNPKELLNKKVILCTHSKLLNEPISLLIDTNYVQSRKYLSNKTRSLTGAAGTLPRQWILIDEGIEINPISSRVSKSVIMSLGELAHKRNYVDYSNGYPLYLSETLSEPMVVRRSGTYLDFTEYLKFMRDLDPNVESFIREERTELDKLRNEQILDELFDNYESYANIKGVSTVNIKYGLASLSVRNMNTHLILFDGTSDITLYNSRKFKLLTYPNKYNSNVILNIIPFSISRSVKYDKNTINVDKYLRDELDKHIDELERIIRVNNKTLIFTWKNFKEDRCEVNDEVDKSLIADTKGVIVLNKVANIPDYIKTKLHERGLAEGINFSIEYYGSGLDKATNIYRDYDTVVLFGRYQVPNYVIDNFNEAFDANISSVEYYSNRVIQAICRTRIRNHRGEEINVYMSSDWSSEVISYIKSYLNINEITNTLISNNVSGIDYMYNKLREIGVTPKKAEQIAKISLLDSNIFNSIVNKVSYECSLKLSDVFNVLPMTERKSSKYIRLIDSLLYNYSIKLSII